MCFQSNLSNLNELKECAAPNHINLISFKIVLHPYIHF